MGAQCSCMTGLLHERTCPKKTEPEMCRLMANAWASPVPGHVNPHLDFVVEDMDSDSWTRQSSTADNVGKTKQTYSRRSKFEVEQLLASPGTLPITAASLLVPASTNMQEKVAQAPVAMLESPTADGQTLRKELSTGSTIVFVSAGYPGKRFIFERAAALGVKSVILDHPDSWSRGLVAEGIASKFLPVDMSQSSETVFKQAEACIRDLGHDKVTGAVDGICTFVELSVPLCARLCETFGLPGLGSEAVDAARDKHKTRAALKAAGLPTPRNALVSSEAELESAGKHVGFPSVLKPVSGAASLAVKKVESMEQLISCYREVATELGSLVVSSGALVKADGSGTGVTAANVVDLTVLLEQYLDGSEVDVDVIVSEGQWRYAAVADNGPTLEPYFNETWGLCPSLLPKDHQRELKDLAVNAVQALGFERGVFHVELKYTSSGPQLIEVNARMGGGPVRECNRLVWGVDLVEETLFCALGIPSRPAVPAVPNTSVGYTFVNAQKSGHIRSTDCFTQLRARDGVLSSDPLVKAGDQVVCHADGLPTWLCLLVVQRPTSRAALDYVLELEKETPVQID